MILDGKAALLGGPARWLGPLLFWSGVLLFYTFYLGRISRNYGQSLLFVAVLLPLTIATASFVTRVLVPRYLLTRRYGAFLLYVGYTLIASVYLELVVVLVVFMTIAEYRLSALNPASVDLPGLLAGMYVVVLLVLTHHLLKRWYRAQADRARLARDKMDVELKLREAELKLLKAQIHPHFLFNTLNNLYGLTLEKSDRAPEMVLRISDMLDYMLYRGAAPTLPLEDEIRYLENYVALERLRYDDRAQISFQVTGSPAGRRIAPLLMIPFVENSFKHGLRQTHGSGWVAIEVDIARAVMTLIVDNSRPPATGAAAAEGTQGIGLTNVQQRLDRLYPGAYALDLDARPDRFRVVLTLTLDRYHDDVPHRG